MNDEILNKLHKIAMLFENNGNEQIANEFNWTQEQRDILLGKKDAEGNTIIGADGKPEMKTIGVTDYDKASWDGGKIAGSVYVPTDISPEDDKQISEWIKTSLNEDVTEKAQWMRRGMIINLLKKYF